MVISLKEQELLNRILLNMRYNPSMTLAENFNLVEHNGNPNTIESVRIKNFQDAIRPFVETLNNSDLFKAANAWGWKNTTGAVYDKPTFEKMSRLNAISFLNSIDYPKFGKKITGLEWDLPPQEDDTDLSQYMIQPSTLPAPTYRTTPTQIDIKDTPEYQNCLITAQPTKLSRHLTVDEYIKYSSLDEYCKYNYSYYKTYEEEWKIKADKLSNISLICGILGMIPTPAAPFLNGIALGCDLAAGSLYYRNGHPYTAAVLAGLSIIPGHQLIKELRVANKITKAGGQKALIETSKKIASGAATKAEEEIFEKTIKEIIETDGEKLLKLTLKELAKKFVKGVFKSIKSLLKLLNWILKTALKFGWNIAKLGFTVGGIWVTFDLLYCAVNINDKRMMELRDTDELGQVRKVISDFSGELWTALMNWVTGEVDNSKIEINVEDIPAPSTISEKVDTTQLSKSEQKVLKMLEDKEKLTPEQQKKEDEKVLEGFDEELEDIVKIMNTENKNVIKVTDELIDNMTNPIQDTSIIDDKLPQNDNEISQPNVNDSIPE